MLTAPNLLDRMLGALGEHLRQKGNPRLQMASAPAFAPMPSSNAPIGYAPAPSAPPGYALVPAALLEEFEYEREKHHGHGRGSE